MTLFAEPRWTQDIQLTDSPSVRRDAFVVLTERLFTGLAQKPEWLACFAERQILTAAARTSSRRDALAELRMERVYPGAHRSLDAAHAKDIADRLRASEARIASPGEATEMRVRTDADAALAALYGCRPVAILATHGDPLSAVRNAMRSAAAIERACNTLRDPANASRSRNFTQVARYIATHDSFIAARLPGVSDRSGRRLVEHLLERKAIRPLTDRAAFQIYGL
jgi:hypothetical protein